MIARTTRNGREMVRLKWAGGYRSKHTKSGWMYVDTLKERMQ